ncbi:MAG: bifunctional diaminohydroxyphosphoribosylaminopyrimidine deaminase/5-amino-6-(5-phosphoribosylamino)uracil reductase RibD [Bacteriovoracaceae bacterium]|jgi:diaminohydroxyphosphoribosylaminopyrimidine deaminase/5-amino-6-(5-phosphoribosylamino)uracil reductase|nr:bifunctional diaminohydroxyphosphoribosylaminopyrimidine deaminase/5-amino-6-(5-phosphoribosylamino)uracil reductase RibD [Bacteriovoracaceae bacterium]
MINVHEKYIKECFELALKAKGEVSPNPLVGSVIVKNGKVIAKGYHKGSGKDHAEIDAIKNATEDIKGATLYCNLEPCVHTNKKTPPCSQRLIKEGIKKVVISNLDPNPFVAGNGAKLLEENGIEVVTGILEQEGLELNEIFFHHITTKHPFIHIKLAQTLDGKMATSSGDSKWITNELSRDYVHKLRQSYDAIMVGKNTVINDDPKLTVRIDNNEKTIKRIVFAPNGIDTSFNLFNDQFKDQTFVASFEDNNYPNFIKLYTNNDQVDLDRFVQDLYGHGICSLFIEGGSFTASKFLEKRLFNKLSVFIAPKLIGNGINIGFADKKETMNESITFRDTKWKKFGDDMMFEAKRMN